MPARAAGGKDVSKERCPHTYLRMQLCLKGILLRDDVPSHDGLGSIERCRIRVARAQMDACLAQPRKEH
eukprot:scaffold190677_cov31-Tisochrysis_lutea.AAC.3